MPRCGVAIARGRASTAYYTRALRAIEGSQGQRVRGSQYQMGSRGREGRKAKNVLGWPERCKLAHAFLWEYSYKKLKLAQLLGQLSGDSHSRGFNTEPSSSLQQQYYIK